MAKDRRLIDRIRTGRLIAVLLGAVLALGLAPIVPSQAATRAVNPDVPRLPVGALPQLPYVDWPGRRIVDGKRVVSISGIQARVTELHKVDGGYLLRRRLNADPTNLRDDLVFVSSKGARKVIAPLLWRPNIKVSKDGGKVVVTRSRIEAGRAVYADTAVLELPSGRLLQARDFGEHEPILKLFGTDRVLLTLPNATDYSDALWWTPATGATETVRQSVVIESADLSAWQWAVRPADGANSYGVVPIPPRTGAGWTISQEDVNLGSWSTDDQLIWGNDEVTESETYSYAIYRASTGERVLTIRNEVAPWAVWESESALLLRAAYGRGAAHRFQLIRCRLSGACSRVGPPSTTELLAIIPATRRG